MLYIHNVNKPNIYQIIKPLLSYNNQIIKELFNLTHCS